MPEERKQHRLEAWVDRDLRALLQTDDVAIVRAYVMGLVRGIGFASQQVGCMHDPQPMSGTLPSTRPVNPFSKVLLQVSWKVNLSPRTPFVSCSLVQTRLLHVHRTLEKHAEMRAPAMRGRMLQPR